MEALSNSQWTAMVASVWFHCSVGASSTFGIYSPPLMSSQGYDQSTLDKLSVFKDIGANAGIVAGLFYTSLTAGKRRQPWLVIALGAMLCFFGYLFMWAVVAGVIRRPPVAVMCLFMSVAAHGQTFFSATNALCGAPNFSGYGGIIAGILKLYAATRIQEFILVRVFS